MKKLYDKFDRFCARNAGKGIPNLMLFISLGIAVVYVFTYIDPSGALYGALRFSRSAILSGQIWRLVTYILIPNSSSVLLLAIQLFFYYTIGKILEREWGTFRFTLFYVSGVLLSAIGGLILGGGVTATYVNLSLFLACATLYPENSVLLFFIIPIKMKYLSVIYFIMLGLGVLTTSFPYNLFPLFSLLNYFFFFWPQISAMVYRFKMRNSGTSRNFRRATRQQSGNPNWAGAYRNSEGARPYRHKCAVCGRTDVDNPELEFRYCSRCNGYYCYCLDHINTHVHIQ